MKRNVVSIRILFLIVTAVLTAKAAAIADFEDLTLSPESSWEPQETSTFSSGNATFNYNFTDWGGGYTSWDGTTYSNQTDLTTAGYTNDTSAYVSDPGDNIYGVTNVYSSAAEPAKIQFDSVVNNAGLSVTNTTYAYLAMAEGDDGGLGGVKKFGGEDGTDEDWFKLTFHGFNGGTETGTVDFYLADYRFENSQDDYIIDDWSFVDLSSLGEIDSIQFSMASTDTGDFGMNTPSYFAMDNVVPEPATMLIFALGALGVTRRRS